MKKNMKKNIVKTFGQYINESEYEKELDAMDPDQQYSRIRRSSTSRKERSFAKFVEIDAREVEGKVGWEMEAGYELIRAAESRDGHMILVYNTGILDPSTEGTYEVGIMYNTIGDYKNYDGLSSKEANMLFDGRLK